MYLGDLYTIVLGEILRGNLISPSYYHPSKDVSTKIKIMNVKFPIVFEKTSKEKRKKAELYQRQKISSAPQELEE